MILESARAVITGGASGLGRATAQRVVDTGGQAAILDLNAELGEKAAAALGKRAMFIRTDASDESSVVAAVEKAAGAFGGLTLAVSCAGILGAGRVLGRDAPMPAAHFQKVLAVNVVGTFLLAREAARHMQDNPPTLNGERGVIISTSSVAAFEGQIGQAAYSASKGAVASMTLPLAREFARFGIRVMTIAPGLFLTPMMEGMPPDVQESLGKQVPFPPRLGRPEEFADLIAHIYANPMLNGETIRLDGAIRLQPK